MAGGGNGLCFAQTILPIDFLCIENAKTRTENKSFSEVRQSEWVIDRERRREGKRKSELNTL